MPIQLEPCPVCGGQTHDFLVSSQVHIRCLDKTCPHNFRDIKCAECGGNFTRVVHPALNEYEFTCENGHEWKKSFTGCR